MLSLNLLKFVLLLSGPIVGYHLAMRRFKVPMRGQVIEWCAAGGTVAAVVQIGWLLVFDLSWFATTTDMLRAALPVVGAYTLFGLGLGLAAVATPELWRRPLFIGGLVLVGLSTVMAVAIHAAMTQSAYTGVSGVVLGPGGKPAAGATVFLDRGSGQVERLTTDTTGLFRAPLESRAKSQAMILICVPGGLPVIETPVENSLTPPHYVFNPLPRRGRVVHGQPLAQRWLRPIPSECWPELAKRHQ